MSKLKALWRITGHSYPGIAAFFLFDPGKTKFHGDAAAGARSSGKCSLPISRAGDQQEYRK
jgi:hypothetical protein